MKRGGYGKKKLTLLVCLSIGLVANESNLFEEIKHYSYIATVSKENALFQPFIESVYKGKELEKLGVSNLQEALAFVPGVDIYSDNLDMQTAIFRGSNPLAYGQSKLFIDGILVNDVMVDQYSHYLAMPIELIKRIEVVRGPGSKIEGMNSYVGSIYVTTYHENFGEEECAKAFVKYGSYRYSGIGMYKNILLGPWKFYTELYLQKDDKAIFAGPDILATGVYGQKNMQLAKSGDIPLWIKNYSFALYGSWKDLKLRLRHNYFKRGHAFGLSYILPHKEDYIRLPSTLLELRYKKSLHTSLQLYVKSGMKRDSFTSLSHVAPSGFIYPNPFNPKDFITFSHGIFGFYQAKQQTLYANVGAAYTLAKHRIDIGVYKYREKTYTLKTVTTDRSGRSKEIIDYSATYPFIKPDASRRATIVYASDTYSVNDDMSIYYGINYETFSKYDCFNPRVSAVYRVNDKNVIKLMYSRSHRNPSWQELFTINNTTRVGNPNLKPERVSAYELSYTNKFMFDQFFQISLFYLKNRNIINNINSKHIFLNHSKNSLYGLEFEWKKMLSNTLEFYGSYSYVYGKWSCGRAMPNIANNLLKLYFVKQWSYDLSSSVSYRYIGAKRRFFFDRREKLKPFHIMNVAFSYKPKKDIEFMIAFKNITGSLAKYPAPPLTYRNDYPYTKGREILLSIKKGF